MTAYATGSLPPPIGALAAQAQTAVGQATATLPPPIGALACRARTPSAARSSLPPPIGALRARARPVADMWALAGLPRLSAAGYGYSRPSGIVRTPFESGATRQRRRWTDGFRQVSASCTLPANRLDDMEGFIAEYGYTWFGTFILTSDSSGPSGVDSASFNVVRVIENVRYQFDGQTVTVTLKFEVQG